MFCVHHEYKTSQLQSLSNVVRMHALQVMKRKTRLHDDTVTIDQDRLVEIPSSGGKPSDHRLTEIQ